MTKDCDITAEHGPKREGAYHRENRQNMSTTFTASVDEGHSWKLLAASLGESACTQVTAERYATARKMWVKTASVEEFSEN